MTNQNKFAYLLTTQSVTKNVAQFIQPGTVKYSMVQPSTAWFSQVQPDRAKYSLIKPSRAWNSHVQPGIATYSLEQTSEA